MASVAAVYARAFADVVLDEHLDVAASVAGLREVARLVSESVPLRRVWENPAVAADQKRHLLDAIVKQEGISKQVRNLVAVLIDHRRIHFLSAIVDQLERELDARMGFAEAQISSVRELGAAEKSSLEGEIQKMTGKKIRAQYALDTSLLGGAVVRIGSTIYDGSVKGQLEKIREAISS